MSNHTAILLANAGALLAYVVAQWLMSIRMRDASLVDRYWGGGFVLAAAVALAMSSTGGWRGPVLCAMASVWGLRLCAYLTWRNWGRGEDYRYQAMRRHHREQFWWRSFFTVFLFQGALTWFISLPLQLGIVSSARVGVTILDIAGIAFWLAGFVFESIGDYQLARFKADPANTGKVMSRGLWRYTRHPNYFGDAMVWWGIYLVAASTPAGRWTMLSPLLMHILLVRVSGVALLEKKLLKTREGYAEYVARTSAFLPWIPKKGG